MRFLPHLFCSLSGTVYLFYFALLFFVIVSHFSTDWPWNVCIIMFWLLHFHFDCGLVLMGNWKPVKVLWDDKYFYYCLYIHFHHNLYVWCNECTYSGYVQAFPAVTPCLCHRYHLSVSQRKRYAPEFYHILVLIF